MSDTDWKEKLTSEQYRILREKATEKPFTGKYWSTTDVGKYLCAGCGNELFGSETKFDAGCGWPSFYAPADEKNITLAEDSSHGMARTEVMCSRCSGHLGHVFDDGPNPTGKRFCINSGALQLKKDSSKKSP